MKINAIKFNGTEKTYLDKSPFSDENLELENCYQIEQTSRGEENRRTIDLKKDHIIEFEFEDGTNWISSPDTLDDIFPELITSVKRSADGAFELPVEISSGSSDRSLVGKVALKVVRIFTKKAANTGIKKLALSLEDKQLDGKIGLFGLNPDFQLINFVPNNSTKPYLLLIHGTATSVGGSFGEAKASDFMNFIRDTYDGRILAFQHRTLTENPLQNVRDLVNALPGNCVLHLVTSSRGGLVGEVLSRFCNSQGATGGFNATELAILKKGYSGEYYKEIEKLIKDIKSILSNKKIVIEKFIRIACPAGGTTLASKRLDYFLNITLNLVGLGIGIAANPLYLAFRNLTAALIESKNKPEVLPGLEVQSPGSPFIKAINCPIDLDNPDGRIVINNSLVVIAGNSKAALKLSALWIIASKLFFLRKNDLIVDTDTMAMGTRRAGKVLRFFYEDAQINHFKYFENKATNQALLLALKSDWGEKLPGFSEEPLSISVAADRNINLKPDGGKIFRDWKLVTGNKPIVLLLPGIMGSNLDRDDNLLWINYVKIISGGLSDLNKENKLKPSSLVSTSYKHLVKELEDNYDVVTFPFDWRMSLEESATDLNDIIIKLMIHNQPIKMIGHSMGGVLIRDFMVLYNDTWKKLNNSDGFRLIFLGAPLNGSFRIPAVLFGADRLIQKLSMIDLLHSKEELISIFSGFRGLLGLLPFDGAHDFSDLETWKKMRNGTDDENWPLPLDEDLKWFKGYRDKMKKAFTKEDIKNAVYIAGRDRSTPCGFVIEEKGPDKELVFMSTCKGDASVTWESVIPKLMKDAKAVYYVNVSHGELACHSDMFRGIKEILVNGSTNLFSDKQPSVRSEEMLFKTPDYRDFDLSQAGIDFSVLGIGGATEPQMKLPPINVSIKHGDLFYAKYPLLAGHFEDDGILFAESEINRNMGHALSYRHRLGIYPGKIGTNDLFLTEQSGFRGTIIVGLGKHEDLTGPELTKTIEQGVSKYILYVADENRRLNSSAEKVKTIGISSLIIGSGYGGLTVENSVKAIIQGVHNANVRVKNLNIENTPLISYIEFVELYEDNAVGALYSLSRLEVQETRLFQIILEEKKLCTLLGSRKRIPNEISPDWWNRITVKKVQFSETDKRVKHLDFSASTSRAHEKANPLPTTPALMEGTIHEMSTSSRWTPQSAKAIFELLIPNDFKEQLKRHGNINWILDHYTAEYPWELLQDEVADSRPLCVVSGMIRQLSTRNYRPVIKSAPKNNALVIADPDLKGFASQLPGALREGQKVAEMLSSRSLDVTTSFKGNSGEIIEKMFCNDYRIIHLSGHGIFNQDETKGSGMVIGKDVYLSTREINQMSTVPELVFVNCCHIGKISGVAEELFQQRYKLAANIGTQLIENGVRCVIAAGWAVDDNAALEFAQVFYERMFAGYNFGASVKDARSQVFEKYGNTNTWGAYQCYGDPFFRFEHIQREVKKKSYEYLISQEAEVDLENLLNELQIGKKLTEEYITMLENITKAVDQAKIRTNSITEKEALIYFELRDYNKTCDKLRSLLNKEEASFSFSVAEKYYNALAKKIATDFKGIHERKNEELIIIEAKIKKLTGDEKNSEELLTEQKQKEECLTAINEARGNSLKNIDKVIADMEALVTLIPSSERFNILGSTYKRCAFISETGKQDNYCSAAAKYQKANAFSGNWYSLTNWLALESVLVLSGLHNWNSDVLNNTSVEYKLPTLDAAIKLLDLSQASLCKNSERMSYWDMLAGINIGFCKYILQFSEKSDKKEFEIIQKEISDLWKTAGSKGKRFAEIEHLEFIIDALSITENKKTNELKARLEQLKKDLNKQIEL